MNLYATATGIPRKVLEGLQDQYDSHDYGIRVSPKGIEITIAITKNHTRREIMGVLTKGDNPEALIQVFRDQIEKIINELNGKDNI